MLRRPARSHCDHGEPFDMTPVIDVVFLLIIFFMLVCQLIVADRFKVDVPQPIAAAAEPKGGQDTLTLTVMPADAKGVVYAVGAERLAVDHPTDAVALTAAAIDDYYRKQPAGQPRIVRLRCDKSVTFGQVKPLLQGIAQSSATDVDWAVRKE